MGSVADFLQSTFRNYVKFMTLCINELNIENYDKLIDR